MSELRQRKGKSSGDGKNVLHIEAEMRDLPGVRAPAPRAWTLDASMKGTVPAQLEEKTKKKMPAAVKYTLYAFFIIAMIPLPYIYYTFTTRSVKLKDNMNLFGDRERFLHTQQFEKKVLEQFGDSGIESKKWEFDQNTFLTEAEMKGSRNDNIVLLMAVNVDVMNMTRNWLCHVSSEIVQSTIFIAVDKLSFESLTSLSNSRQLGLSIFYSSPSEKELEYLTYSRYDHIFLVRLRHTLDILDAGLSVMWVEPNMIVKGGIFSLINNTEERYGSPVDFILPQRATRDTRGLSMFMLIRKTQASVESLNSLQELIKEEILNGDSQTLRRITLGFEKDLASLRTISSAFFENSEVASKSWFQSEHLQKEQSPSVFLLNLPAGEEKFIPVLKEKGLWYLQSDGVTCTNQRSL